MSKRIQGKGRAVPDFRVLRDLGQRLGGSPLPLDDQGLLDLGFGQALLLQRLAVPLLHDLARAQLSEAQKLRSTKGAGRGAQPSGLRRCFGDKNIRKQIPSSPPSQGNL